MRGSSNLPTIETVISELNRLPGLGPKSATALAYHLVSLPEDRVRRLADSLAAIPGKIRNCSVCGNLTEEEPCGICQDPAREEGSLCVVERPLDVLSIEKTSVFHGRYHVLGGVLSPLDGIGPAELRIRELLGRLRESSIQEIILATNPSVEGEATAAYLSEVIGGLGMGITLTRFSRGLPIGGELIHTDAETLALAFRSRKPVESSS